MPRTLWAALVLVVAASAACGAEFPFSGYVGVDRAEVASGPGRRFYTTDRLPRGVEVQVFREDEAGWLAIRPPEGSFSWIPADQVEVAEGESVGKVLAATACWIGTNVERVEEHRSLVTLKPGELVQILDRRTVSGAEGAEQAWFKIAPPAGEFRYIHGRDISREPVPADEPEAVVIEPIEPAEFAEEDPQPQRFRPAGSAIALEDIGAMRGKLPGIRSKFEELAETESRPAVELAQYRSSVSETSDKPVSPDGFVPRKRRGSEQLQPVPVPSGNLTRSTTPAFSRPKLDPPARLVDSRPITASPNSGQIANTIASDDVARQLEQLELDLSLMLSQDRSTWDLAGLRRKVEDVVERGAQPADRGTARLLFDKIKQFEETFDVADFGPVAGAAPTTVSTTPAGASPADPRYDGKGWLKPVISRSKPAAPFALVDADGKPLYFITPSPGLNLSNYVNKQVGVYGRRGYLESLKTPHVTAERIIDLDRQWR